MTRDQQAINRLEERRLLAWRLKQQGWKQKDIAAALDVSEGAVSQWMKQGRLAGIDGLRHRPIPGLPPRLSKAQRDHLSVLLERGPAAYGFPEKAWTGAQMAVVIQQVFGVSYHEGHVRRLLRAIQRSQP